MKIYKRFCTARLRDVLDYDPDTGIFTWLVDKSGRAKAGYMAGCRHKSGYVHIRIDGKPYYAHRLAWHHYYGEPPDLDIDHINGVRHDNRICNLRPATNSENHLNTGKPRTNTSGFKGVGWHKRDRKWQARMKYQGKYIHIGLFDCVLAASAAYESKARELCGEFYRSPDNDSVQMSGVPFPVGAAWQK